MAAENQDIRIVKSRRALAAAFFRLLEKQSFQKLSVNDICQEALVSRSTFYVHFEDKYHLLQHCLEELKTNMTEAASFCAPAERLQAALQYVADHAAIFRNIFISDPSQELLKMFQSYFSHDILAQLEQRPPKKFSDRLSLSLLARFYAGGLATTISWWIEDGFRTSVAEMAEVQLTILQALWPEAEPYLEN